MAELFRKQKKIARTNAEPRFGPDLHFASAEAYNLLRTNLSFSMPGKQGSKIIGITSSCPQEGKSFTSINIAYAFAKNGHKTLLLEADMRRPSIAGALGEKRTPGLSNVLSGQCDDSCVRNGLLHENLSIMFAGEIPPNPSELIGSNEMKLFMDRMSEQYEYVIVDLPPIISVADALIISKYIDGMVMILRHGQTRRKNVVEAVRQLRFANVHILGFVYNGYRRGNGYYNKNRRYYKKYGYGYTSKKKSKENAEANSEQAE